MSALWENHARIAAHVLVEVRPVLRERHDLGLSLDPHVVGQVQGRPHDHAQAAIAPDRAVEQLGVLGRACIHDISVGQDQADRLHG